MQSSRMRNHSAKFDQRECNRGQYNQKNETEKNGISSCENIKSELHKAESQYELVSTKRILMHEEKKNCP